MIQVIILPSTYYNKNFFIKIGFILIFFFKYLLKVDNISISIFKKKKNH